MTVSREIIWRRTMDDASFEHARIVSDRRGRHISGVVLVAEEQAPLRVDYRVACDPSWRTRRVEVNQTWRGRRQSLRLERDDGGQWRRDGALAPELAGCTDVDLGLSPSTNALPINLLQLAPGQAETIRAAWVRFPAFEVAPAEQSYARLDRSRYRYRSLASGFEAELSVDSDGFPIEYAGVWRRIAEGPLAAEGAGDAFAAALLSPDPSPELAQAAQDFSWLIGGWSAEVTDYPETGEPRRSRGEWWFSWVLDGRAMQDVWISPPRDERSHPTAAGNRYGTTIRRFDRDAGQWLVSWFNPVTGASTHLAGRREGNRIMLTGEDNGAIRWTFNDITADAFVWRGERQAQDGTWRLEAEFAMRRITF